MHGFVECKTFRAPARLDVDDDVAELAVAARLLLVAAADRRRLADRLAIRNRRFLRIDRHAEARRKLLQRDANMHLALAEELHLARGLILHKVSDGSSSASFAIAAAKRTSSLRSFTFSAKACTGCGGV